MWNFFSLKSYDKVHSSRLGLQLPPRTRCTGTRELLCEEHRVTGNVSLCHSQPGGATQHLPPHVCCQSLTDCKTRHVFASAQPKNTACTHAGTENTLPPFLSITRWAKEEYLQLAGFAERLMWQLSRGESGQRVSWEHKKLTIHRSVTRDRWGTQDQASTLLRTRSNKAQEHSDAAQRPHGFTQRLYLPFVPRVLPPVTFHGF